MQYLGGKSRLAKEIAAHLEACAQQLSTLGVIMKSGYAQIEDRFCGALSVAAAIKHRPLICSDANAALICTLKKVQEGWNPPLDLSEEEYKALKKRNDSTDPMTAFAAAGCSFGGKWWGGYARQRVAVWNKGRQTYNYAAGAARSLINKTRKPAQFEIICRDYREDLFKKTCRPRVVYFDPPYRDSVGYPAVGDFDHDEFWNLAGQLARSGVVVRVSEYAAPDGWISACSFGQKQILGRSRGAKKVREDHLFKLDGAL